MKKLIERNQNRLQKGKLCKQIPSGMKLCCVFEEIPGMEMDFSDGSGY